MKNWKKHFFFFSVLFFIHLFLIEQISFSDGIFAVVKIDRIIVLCVKLALHFAASVFFGCTYSVACCWLPLPFAAATATTQQRQRLCFCLLQKYPSVHPAIYLSYPSIYPSNQMLAVQLVQKVLLKLRKAKKSFLK